MLVSLCNKRNCVNSSVIWCLLLECGNLWVLSPAALYQRRKNGTSNLPCPEFGKEGGVTVSLINLW